MMNLLPPSARKNLAREYWLRVASLWAVLLSGVLLGIGALLVPSYILMRSEHTALETERAALRAENGEAAATERLVKDTNALAAELKRREVSPTVTSMIHAVQDAVPEGIDVRSYEISRTEDGAIEEVSVTGVASSRDVLVAFKDALEEQEAFVSAEVPIGDLIREEDLPFQIIISVAEASS